MKGQLYEIGKGTHNFVLEIDLELNDDYTRIGDYYFFRISPTRAAVIYRHYFYMIGLPNGFEKNWYELEKKACTECDCEISTLDMFIDWSENGQPCCIDCGVPLFEYYRDSNGDYRCEECHYKKYSKEEWESLYEEDPYGNYWTSCR